MTPDVLMTDTQKPPSAAAPNEAPPLKILFVSPTLIPGGGVAPPVELANQLATQGQVVQFAAAVGPLRIGLSRTINYFLTDDAEDAPVKTAHELSGLLRHHKPDVVHSHGARCGVVSALAIKASHCVCVRVMTYHSRQMRRFPRWLKGPMLRHSADCYFAASEDLRAELERMGVPSERILIESIDPADAMRVARDSVAIYRKLLAGNDGT
jgi:hypothetical protein